MTSDNLPEVSGDFDLRNAEFYDRMNHVVEEMLKGQNIAQISKTLGMKRHEVVSFIESWQDIARHSNTIQDRASDAIAGADQHYSMVIARLWETVEQADQNNETRTKAGVLKSIADVEQKRIDMLQKAGLLENQDLAQQMIDTEEKHEAIMALLKSVAADCDHCRVKILKGISEITGKGEGVEA